MKEHETLSKEEQLFAQVLEECLEEDLSFTPPEREIARIHRFSEKFEETMKELLDDSSNKIQKKKIQRHFSPRYGQWAACILVFCICGGLLYHMLGTNEQKVTRTEESTEAKDTASYDMAAGTLEEATTEEAPADEPTEEAYTETNGQESQSAKENSEDAGALEAEKLYQGEIVDLAEQQEIPQSLEDVTMRINCPVLDEENPVIFLTIGNTGEETVEYLNQYELEIWIDNGWYQIPSKPEEQRQGQWLTLEPGMAMDEEIDLTHYGIDFDAQRYRLITYVGEKLISVEFTFAGSFTETMERLEEKENSKE